MKKITCALSVLFITCLHAFAQQADCDKCLPSKVFLSEGILHGKDLGDEEKYNAFAELLKATYSHLKNQDPDRGCMNITTMGRVEKSPYSVIADISESNGKGTLKLILLTQCGSKEVATSMVSVDLAGGEEAIKAAAEKAAKQLMPLSEKILVHALNLRENNTAYMLNGDVANMEIRLQDPKVPVGQETEMYVRMTDCDGYPLKNRTVNFKAGTVKGRQIPGVIGGVVTPSSGKTDATGRLKVRFKRTANSAMIFGHYKGFNATGCEDGIVGVINVGDMPVKVVLKYKYYHEGNAVASEGGINDYSATEEQTCNIISYYFPAQPLPEKFSLSIPLKSGKGGKLVYLKEEGTYETHTAATGDAAPLVFGDLNASNLSRMRSGSIGAGNRTSIRLFWSGLSIGEPDTSGKEDLYVPLPVNPRFKNGLYAGSKAEIVFAYTPDEIEQPAVKDDDLFVPLPGDKAATVKRQVLNTPVKDIYFDESTRGAWFKEIKFSKEENPSYKKMIQFGLLTDRHAPAHKIMGDNVNLLVGDTLLEICLVEVYVPR